MSDNSIPRLLVPVADAELNQLLGQLKSFTELQSLRTTRVGLRFIEPQAEERWRDAEAAVVLQRPDKFRLIIQIPALKSRVAEMVSEANHFKVAVYREKPGFLIGTNDADYSRWRERLGKDQQSALANARPFHFTEALMMKPLQRDDANTFYLLEEQLQEELVTKPSKKTQAKVWRSFYVVTEAQRGTDGQTRVNRRFWFDRNDQLRFARQQLFDAKGGLMTEVYYANYQKLNADSETLWPSVITVSRPHDDYAARFAFQAESFEVNPELPATAFVLENKENLPVTDLDKP